MVKPCGDLSFGELVWSHRKTERLASVEQAVRLAEVFEMSPEIFVIQSLQDLVNKAGLDIKIKSA